MDRREAMKLLVSCALVFGAGDAASQAPPLPTWNEGAAMTRIIEFVRAVSDPRGKDFVASCDRIAVFDNDGTLWAEQPLYFQAFFMLDQVKKAAPQHPEWKDNPAFQALAAQDKAALGHKPILELMEQANSGMTVGEYDKTIRDWLATARHPKYKRAPNSPTSPCRSCLGTCAAMVSALSSYPVVPPEQVLGSQQELKFDMKDGKPVLTREAKMAFVDDGPGKPRVFIATSASSTRPGTKPRRRIGSWSA